MQRDVIRLSKEVSEFFYDWTREFERIENKYAWVRDYVLDQWIEKNGVIHLFRCNDTLDGQFISDLVLDAFCDADCEQQANCNLNYLLFKLCEKGYEI